MKRSYQKEGDKYLLRSINGEKYLQKSKKKINFIYTR